MLSILCSTTARFRFYIPENIISVLYLTVMVKGKEREREIEGKGEVDNISMLYSLFTGM